MTSVAPVSTDLPRYTASFGLSLAITRVINALLVIAKERNPKTLMAWMSPAAGHHWATHSLISLGLFFGLGLTLAWVNGGAGVRLTARRLSRIILAGVAFEALIIVGYYTILD